MINPRKIHAMGFHACLLSYTEKCSGSDEGEYVGFNGSCSEEIIKLNVKRHVWCGNKDCECTKYFKNGFKGNKPDYPCMESKLNPDLILSNRGFK